MRNEKGQFVRGHEPYRYWLGKKHSEEHRKKNSRAHKGKGTPASFVKCQEKNRGSTHYRWKGEAAGYTSIHQWLAKHFGKPDHCDLCGRNKKRGEKRKFEWARRAPGLDRNLQNWWQLCVKCHRRYDNNPIASGAYANRNRSGRQILLAGNKV